MPLYEYQCKKCKHKFEKIQKFSDPLVKKCPECGGAVEQTISAPAVQFKGSGFYVNDYSSKKQESSKSEGGSHDHDEKSGESKDKDKSDNKAKKSTAKKVAEKT